VVAGERDRAWNGWAGLKRSMGPRAHAGRGAPVRAIACRGAAAGICIVACAWSDYAWGKNPDRRDLVVVRERAGELTCRAGLAVKVPTDEWAQVAVAGRETNRWVQLLVVHNN
jgi:hypothetical protein